MKTITHTILLSLFCLLFSTSCVKKAKEQIEDSPVIVHENDLAREDDSNTPMPTEQIKDEPRRVKIRNTGEAQSLKKYSVVVATLTQQNGINALKQFFERDGIDYFVVKNSSGSYYFVVFTSDSEEEAIKARSVFLLENTVDKSREDIWHQYYIQLTDAFILEKK